MILFNRRITVIDVVLGFLLLAVVYYVYHRLSSGLQYNWRWELIPQYLLRYDADEDEGCAVV